MTIREAYRAASEINLTRDGSDHAAALAKAIEEMDLEKLDELLKYGENNND